MHAARVWCRDFWVVGLYFFMAFGVSAGHQKLLSVSVLFHSVLSDPCFDSVCQAMPM